MELKISEDFMEGLKARKLPEFLASWPPSLQAMSYQLRAICLKPTYPCTS